MQDRVTEVEIKLAYLEDHLNVLNDTVIRQQTHIERLELALERLRDRLEAATEAEAAGDPAGEQPPHY